MFRLRASFFLSDQKETKESPGVGSEEFSAQGLNSYSPYPRTPGERARRCYAAMPFRRPVGMVCAVYGASGPCCTMALSVCCGFRSAPSFA